MQTVTISSLSNTLFWKARVAIALLPGVFAITQTAVSADLVDVRTGFHRTYSRVVIQFDSQVRFQVIKDTANGTIIIDVLGVNAIRNLGSININPKDSFLKSVFVKRGGHFLSVTGILKTQDVRIEHYFLKHPFRIVVDIYPSLNPNQKAESSESAVPREQRHQPEQPGFVENAQKRDSLQVTKTDSFILVADDSLFETPTAPYYSTEDLFTKSIIPLEQSLKAVKSELRGMAKKRPHKQDRMLNKYNLVIAIISGFVLIDIIILAVYLMRRTRKRKLTQSGKDLRKKQAPATPLSNQEFVDVLKSTLREKEIEEVRQERIEKNISELAPEKSADHLESLMKQAANMSRGLAASPPELHEVARDLGSIVPSSSAWQEFTREDLIGKDGAEFLKNLKKHSLN